MVFASEEPNLRGIQHSIILYLFSLLPCALDDLELTPLQCSFTHEQQ